MRIYLSTTIDDMSMERKIIKEVIKEEKLDCHIIDLRDFDYYKIEELCYDSMSLADGAIFFLGQRYGSFIQNKQKLLRDLHIQLYDENISISELEYIYFQALKMNGKNNFFYIRNPIDNLPIDLVGKYQDFDEIKIAKNNQFQEKLKKANLNLREYHISYDNGFVGYDELKSNIKEDLMLMYKRVTNTECYFKSIKGSEYALNELKADLVDHINQNPVTIIKGVKGSGKSSLMSYLYSYFSKRDDCLAYSGHTVNNASDIVVGLNEFLLGKGFNLTHTYDDLFILEALRRQNTDLGLLMEDSERDLYIFVDDLELMMEDDIRNQMKFIPYLMPTSMHFIIAIDDGFSLPYIPVLNQTLNLGLLGDKDFVDFTRGYFEAHRDIRLITKEMAKSIGRKQMARNPLYLKMLYSYLLRDYDNTTIEDLPDDIFELGRLLIGDNILYRLIAKSKHGLSYQDLLNIYNQFELDSNNILNDIYLMNDFIFLDNQGRYRFNNLIFSQIVLEDMNSYLIYSNHHKLYYNLDDLNYDLDELCEDLFDLAMKGKRLPLLNEKLLCQAFDCYFTPIRAKKILPVLLDNKYDGKEYNVLLGKAYYYLGDFYNAINYLDQGFMLGNSYLNMGKAKEASDAYPDKHLKSYALNLANNASQALALLGEDMIDLADKAMILRDKEIALEAYNKLKECDETLFNLDILQTITNFLAKETDDKKYLDEALELSRRLLGCYNDQLRYKSVVMCNSRLSEYHARRNEFDLAVNYDIDSLSIASGLYEVYGLKEELRTICLLAGRIGSYRREAKYFDNYMKYAHILENNIAFDADLNLLFDFYNRAHVFYQASKRSNEAISCLHNIIHVAKKIYHKTKNTEAYLSIIRAYSVIFMNDKNSNMLNECLDFIKNPPRNNANVDAELAGLYITIADKYMASKKANEALSYLRKASALKSNDYVMLGVCGRLASLYMMKKEARNALDYALKALAIEEKLKLPQLKDRYLMLAGIYNQLNDKENANKMIIKAKQLVN